MNAAINKKLDAMRLQLEAGTGKTFVQYEMDRDEAFFSDVAKGVKKKLGTHVDVKVKRGIGMVYLEGDGVTLGDLSIDFQLSLFVVGNDVKLYLGGNHAANGKFDAEASYKTGVLTPDDAVRMVAEKFQ